MKRLAIVFGMAVAAVLGFLVLGNSHSAEGPDHRETGSKGGVISSAADSGGKGSKDSAPQGVPVTPTYVLRRDIEQVLEVSGTLKTDEDVEIGSRMEGRVLAVFVKEGDRVSRGQLLVRLDDRELQAQMARARATLSAAQARLSLSRNQATWKDQSARSDHDRAEAALRAAQTRLQESEVNRRLVETQTRLAVDTARSGVRVATERLSIARDLTRKQELRQGQLAIEQARAELAQARVNTENARQMLERRQTLFRQDAVAREEVDEADRRHRSMQAQERVAEATVTVAEQRLELAKEGSRPEEVRIAEGQLAAAERNLTLAQSDEQKREVAAKEVETARAAVQQAEAAVAASKAGLVQSRMSQDDIAAANAAILQANADIQFYQAQLTDLEIRAPVAGVVATRSVNAGEMVSRTTRLMNLLALDAVYLELVVPELDAAQLRPGMPAVVEIDAVAGRKLQATVREVIPAADRSSRSMRARVALLDQPRNLPPGGFARAVVHVGTHRQIIAVEKSALNSESGDKYVWLVNENEKGTLAAKRQQVRVGLVDDRYAEILSGLTPGQRLIGAGSPTIIEGTTIKIADPAGK
jgi:HlyD family secretion protein